MTERTAAHRRERLESGSPLRAWYGVAAGPLAWVLQASLSWLITGRACADGDAAWGPLSPLALRGLLLLVGAAAMAAGVFALVFSVRGWRDSVREPRLTEAHAYRVSEYVAVAGVLVSGAFLLAIFWTALPAVMVDVCQGWR